jgi:hypothetical protein
MGQMKQVNHYNNASKLPPIKSGTQENENESKENPYRIGSKRGFLGLTDKSRSKSNPR